MLPVKLWGCCMDRDTLLQRKTALDGRRELVRGLRRIAAIAEAEGRYPATVDRLRSLAAAEAAAIDRDLGELAAEARAEIWRCFNARFELTREQRRELGRLRHGREIRAAWNKLLLSRQPRAPAPAVRNNVVAFPTARPRQARPRARTSAAGSAASEADPEPVRAIRGSRIWPFVGAWHRGEILALASRRPFRATDAAAIDELLREATGGRWEQPGALWLPGLDIPRSTLLLRYAGLWRAIAVTAEAWASFECEGNA